MRPMMPILGALSLALLAIGCDRSDEAAVTQAKAETESVRAELEKEKARADAAVTEAAPEKSQDADHRAAEWVLRVEGTIRAVVDGVPLEIKKGEKLPEGSVKLLAVDLCGCPKATDDGRDYLRGLEGLQELRINDGAGIRNFDFLADMTGLQTLASEGATPLFSDADFVHIKEMKQLKTLAVVNQFADHPNEKLTGDAFAAIKELRQLESLRLCNCNLKGDGIRQLDGHPTLRALDFWQSKIEDSQLAALATLPQLESLGLVGTPITDKGLDQLQGCRHLARLWLEWTAVTDEGLKSLSGLKLNEVSVRHTQVTEKGAMELENAIPGLKVYR